MEKRQPRKAKANPRASTPAILGTASGEFKIKPKWGKYYRSLSRMREAMLRLRSDLIGQAAEESTPAQRNMADLGTDHYDRDWALSMASSEQEVLYEIEEALNRIKNGTYGTCQATGQPIEPERLSAIPWTRFSAEAEKQLENEGQIHRTRLGEREEVPKETATEADQD